MRAISPFVPADSDPHLAALARDHGCKVIGSTSSVTPILSKLYNFISNQRPCDMPAMSSAFAKQPSSMVLSMQRPIAMNLKNDEGRYTIAKKDVAASMLAYPSAPADQVSVLTDLGHVLENFLTMEPEDFQNLMVKPARGELTEEQSRAREKARATPQIYNFLRVGNCLFRSQLDCYDPATGKVFDIKTRATAGIRYNMENYKEHLHTKQANIDSLLGFWSSYEREYYDLVRSKFLPFSLQLRIGQMDGAFLAYHNVREMFGFQYVSLEEIEHRIYGSSERADWAFDRSCKLLEMVMAAIHRKHGDAGDLALVTTIGRDSLDFYVDADEDAGPVDRKVSLFRLELKREMGGRVIPNGEPIMDSRREIRLSSSLTESEVPLKHYQKYLMHSMWSA